jgi:hypothetical protein
MASGRDDLIDRDRSLSFPSGAYQPERPTGCLAAGVHPKVVQERLGHSQVSVTLDTYSHVTPSLQREAARRIDGLLESRPRRGGAG